VTVKSQTYRNTVFATPIMELGNGAIVGMSHLEIQLKTILAT